MGILDMVESMAGGGGDHAKVAGGLVQELQGQPGGVSGMFQSFQQNGMGGLAQQWAGGQTQSATPEQMQQGLGGTGIIDRISQRTGLPASAVQMGLAAAVPLVIHHFVSNGHMTADGQPTGSAQPEMGGVLQSILGRM